MTRKAAPKKPARKKTVGPPAHLVERMMQDAGKGLSDRITDRAFWLDVDSCSEPWIEALAVIDKQQQDVGPLIALLRSDATLPANARHHLADLLERYRLRRPPGEQRTPSYDMTEKESRMVMALDAVRAGSTFAAAARQHGVDEETLHDAYDGKHGATRRAKRRLRQP